MDYWRRAAVVINNIPIELFLVKKECDIYRDEFNINYKVVGDGVFYPHSSHDDFMCANKVFNDIIWFPQKYVLIKENESYLNGLQILN